MFHMLDVTLYFIHSCKHACGCVKTFTCDYRAKVNSWCIQSKVFSPMKVRHTFEEAGGGGEKSCLLSHYIIPVAFQHIIFSLHSPRQNILFIWYSFTAVICEKSLCLVKKTSKNKGGKSLYVFSRYFSSFFHFPFPLLGFQ